MFNSYLHGFPFSCLSLFDSHFATNISNLFKFIFYVRCNYSLLFCMYQEMFVLLEVFLLLSIAYSLQIFEFNFFTYVWKYVKAKACVIQLLAKPSGRKSTQLGVPKNIRRNYANFCVTWVVFFLTENIFDEERTLKSSSHFFFSFFSVEFFSDFSLRVLFFKMKTLLPLACCCKV